MGETARERAYREEQERAKQADEARKAKPAPAAAGKDEEQPAAKPAAKRTRK